MKGTKKIYREISMKIYFKLFPVSRMVQSESDETSSFEDLNVAEEYENIIKNFAKATYITQLEELEKSK